MKMQVVGDMSTSRDCNQLKHVAEDTQSMSYGLARIAHYYYRDDEMRVLGFYPVR